MHWVVTMPSDVRGRELVDILGRTGTPHDVVAGGTVPGSIVPDVDPEGPVVCFGSPGLRRVAKAKGWSPGALDVEWLDHRRCVEAWGEAMLNGDAAIGSLSDLPRLADEAGHVDVFLRPARDDKSFEAKRMARSDVAEWVAGLVASGVDPTTGAIVGAARVVLAEWRTWVVGGEVVTTSLYRRGGGASFDGDDAPPEMLRFARDRAKALQAASGDAASLAYVLDVCLSEAGMRIVEVNGMCGARLYGCDVGRLFAALDVLEC